MTVAEDRKLWTDHPNPVVAESERLLYLAGAQALERIYRDTCAALGVAPHIVSAATLPSGNADTTPTTPEKP